MRKEAGSQDQIAGPARTQDIAVQFVVQQISERPGERHDLHNIDPGLDPRLITQIEHISVEMFPAAPGTKGQPPRPPKELSNWVIPASIAAMILAIARPRVL